MWLNVADLFVWFAVSSLAILRRTLAILLFLSVQLMPIYPYLAGTVVLVEDDLREVHRVGEHHLHELVVVVVGFLGVVHTVAVDCERAPGIP